MHHWRPPPLGVLHEVSLTVKLILRAIPVRIASSMTIAWIKRIRPTVWGTLHMPVYKLRAEGMTMVTTETRFTARMMRKMMRRRQVVTAARKSTN